MMKSNVVQLMPKRYEEAKVLLQRLSDDGWKGPSLVDLAEFMNNCKESRWRLFLKSILLC